MPAAKPEGQMRASHDFDPDEKPIPVGIGLVARERCFLVRRRPEQTVYAGYWEFPGGKCEPGESPAAAVERECREETGLTVVVGERRSLVLHRYPHGLVELHFHDCVPGDPTAEPAAETGFRWIAAAELAALRFPEANDAIIDELAREAGRAS
jgi:8-oxo-dGTP diphosphatase